MCNCMSNIYIHSMNLHITVGLVKTRLLSACTMCSKCQRKNAACIIYCIYYNIYFLKLVPTISVNQHVIERVIP